MSIAHSLLDALFIVIQVLMGAIGLYQLVLSIAGFPRREEKCVQPLTKTFAILVSAHNEEEVIGPLVENLKSLDYPKELYDIFVICDNCTDRTADIVRSHGVYAMERFDQEKRGKGFAIEWMLAHLWERKKQYDAVLMFDADNLASKNFLIEMNEKLHQGAKVIQGYLDIKNPYDSWVSASYAVAYWFTNRMWQLARYNLRMPNALGGTGLCIDAKLLKQIGWGATSLTEDLEYSVRCVERKIYPTWAHNAKVYDEKPITLKASMRQRLRWMQGHFACAHRYFWPLIFKSIRNRSLSQFDAALYLFQPMRLLIVVATMIMLLLQVGTPLYRQLGLSQVVPVWFWWVINIVLYLQTPIAMMLEKKPLRAYLGLLVYPFFTLTWIPVTFVAYFTKNNKTWNHTVHTRSIRIEEVS